MKSKTLALLALVALSLGLAACGSSNTSNPQNGQAGAPGVAQPYNGYSNWGYGNTYNGSSTSGYYYAPISSSYNNSYGGTWSYLTPSGNSTCPYGYSQVPNNAYYCQMAAGTQLTCPSGWMNTGTSCVPQQNYSTSCSGTIFQLCTYTNSSQYSNCGYNGYGLVCKQ